MAGAASRSPPAIESLGSAVSSIPKLGLPVWGKAAKNVDAF